MPHTATLKPLGPHPAAAAADALPLFSFAMLSHPGRVRHTNQDACAALPEHSAFVVCDGVGGAAGGEIASHLAVDAFLNTLSQSSPTAPRRKARSSPAAAPAEPGTAESGAAESKDSAGPLDTHHPHARLREAVRTANLAVFQRAQKSRALRGMATTLVAALFDRAAAPAAAALPDSTAAPAKNGASGPSVHNGHTSAVAEEVHTLWLAHVGDSRCYRLRRRTEGAEGVPAALEQLTCDHSLVEEQIRAGVLSRAEAEHSPVRNVITRAVGAAPAVEPEIAAHAIQPGDLYLLASDGLTRELDDAAIAGILSQVLAAPAATDSSAPSPAASPALESAARALGRSPQASAAALEMAARALIDAANAHGGNDNITVVLLACR